jgi:predicted TIM-barrel fold metal-dependent hydrolase
MPSRRRFLGDMLGAAASIAAALTPAPAQAQTAPVKHRRLIVDSQVHLWDGAWPGSTAAQLPEPFTYAKLLPLMDEAGVDRAVIVTPGGPNDYPLEAAAKYPDRFAVMGVVPITDPKTAERLPTWRQQPGMLGIRTFFNRTASVRLRDGTVDWLWPAAEKAGIPVMFLAFDMGALTNIVERHPGLVVIIDHMGLSKEAVNEGLRDALIATTVSLAKFPNVSVKLSGIGAYSSEPYPWRDMTTYIQRVFDAYGPQRCYWGTDITNSFGKASYAQRVAHIEDLTFLSEDDKDWILGRAILERLSWKA